MTNNIVYTIGNAKELVKGENAGAFIEADLQGSLECVVLEESTEELCPSTL